MITDGGEGEVPGGDARAPGEIGTAGVTGPLFRLVVSARAGDGDARAPAASAPPDAAWAVELLREAAPHQVPAGRKQRVRLALGQPGGRRVPAFLRPVIVAGMLIGCGAIASAALGHMPDWVVRAYRHFVPAAPVVASSTPPVLTAEAHARAARRAPEPVPGSPSEAGAAPHAGGASATGTPASPVTAGAGVAVSTSPAATTPPAARAVHRDGPSGPRARRAPSLAASSPAAAAGEDTSLVLEAMRALRLERNPGRARNLLTKYLDQHPNGTLSEEALAMTIEAAVARRDPDAAALGARYLRLYPAGPFRALASQTTGAPTGAGPGPATSPRP